MTTKQKFLNEILERVFEVAHSANDEADQVWKKVEKGEKELTDFARSIGVQVGVNRILTLLTELWDESTVEGE